MRILGLDVGDARVGLAISDPERITAQPLDTVPRDENTVTRISEIIGEFSVSVVVIGLPLLMSGKEGEQARKVREFSQELSSATGVPISFIDERLTSREAEGLLLSGGVKRKKRKSASDRLAASLILRSYLDQDKDEH